MNAKKLIAILVLFAAIFAASAPAAVPNAPTPKNMPEMEEYYDLLVLGVDKRPGEKNGRSDVILIVHCEPTRVTLFSIPRDTVAPIRRKRDKINAAYSWGNIALAKTTIEGYLKFKVDNYIVVDFKTFMATVDTIKALTDNGRLIGAENFLVSGENLLKWLRWRGMPTGDRRRCQRHQLFIRRVYEYADGMHTDQRALFEQCVKAGLKVVQTDATYEHIAKLFETYKGLDQTKNLERFVLPGRSKTTYASAADGKRELTGYYYHGQFEGQSLMTYLRWFRKNNLLLNYVEEDTLRK